MRLQTLAAAIATAVLGAAAPAMAAPCDRACLVGLVDAYQAALVKHDPKALPLAPGVRFTENTARIKLGEGFWFGAQAAAPGALRIVAADPTAGQAGLLAAMKENGKPVILILRLKVADGRIAEIEQVVQRAPADPNGAGMTSTRAAFVTPVPAAQRTPRAQMLKIADSYFTALDANDGALAPFAEDCDRHEDGAPSTHVKPGQRSRTDPGVGGPGLSEILAMGCHDQVSSGVLTHITAIQPRRPLVVDEELGLVFCFPVFIHRGDVQAVNLKGVPGIERFNTPTAPSDTHGGEVMKITAGQIHEVEVAGVRLPYGLGTGWD